MTNRVILRVDSGVDHGASVSRALADDLVEDLVGENDTLVVRDVSGGLPFVDPAWVYATFGDGDKSALALSEQLIDELMNAHELVVVAPIYNLGIPATLKAWIDQVIRVGRTFRFGPTGPEGLLPLERVWIVTTSGGTPVGSPIDFNTPYLRAIFGFVGVNDVRVVAPTERLHVAEPEPAPASAP